MARVKRNLFALVGWLVWKLLSFFGFKFAKEKLRSNEKAASRSHSSSRR